MQDSPLYTMHQCWNYKVKVRFLGNTFSINKSGLPFTAIGLDHALDQNNGLLKVKGRIIRVTKNELV